jgi:hypothetical protein
MLLINGSSVTMYNTSNNSDIISRQVIYPVPYTKVTVVLDYIKPSNTSITLYYSPNDGFAYQGTEWKLMHEVQGSTIILDQALQIYRTTYFLEESSIYHVQLDERVKFRYRIVLEPDNNGISPLIKNVQTYVE